MELVCYHLVAIASVDKLSPEKLPVTGRKVEDAIKSHRLVDYIETGVHMAVIYNADLLEPGMSFSGPAILEESGATIVIPPAMSCHVDDYGNYHLQAAQ